jgi:hypothetical protein
MARISLLLAFSALAALAAGTETLGFEPGGVIRIEHPDGSLQIEAWDQAKVEITTSETAKARITTSRPSPSELLIETERSPHPNRLRRIAHAGIHADADYLIRIPRNSRLIIQRANGYVGITGVSGDIEADNRRGDIVLMLPELAKWNIDARTKIGAVTSDAGGTAHSRHITGESFTSGASETRRLRLRMGFGGIAIKDMPAEAIGPS